MKKTLKLFVFLIAVLVMLSSVSYADGTSVTIYVDDQIGYGYISMQTASASAATAYAESGSLYAAVSFYYTLPDSANPLITYGNGNSISNSNSTYITTTAYPKSIHSGQTVEASYAEGVHRINGVTGYTQAL